jgi:hypothetical protein
MESAYILVACVGKDNDRESCQHGDWTGPSEDAYFASFGEGIALDEMCYNQNYEVGDGA